MALSLGVDTGGTYTDAVILRDEREVLARSKALTTKEDLSLGVGSAVAAVLEESAIAPGEIAMAALSTTLATNALVEGQGGRIGFVAIGFAQADLEKHGLIEAMRGDPFLCIAGGHSHAGEERAVLDSAAVETWLADLEGITGFAVAGQFAVRNPAHEQAVADLLRAVAPVSCSHELSAKLGGPKRAMTAVLNARLIGLTHALIGKAERELVDRGISAPLMVVRGDGALMSSAQAKARPIETILSGPAASIVGARWLTGAETALVSDIGGTTTDIALLRGGRPAIDPEGARVGPYRTMVEAVAMRTHGLGGDSAVAMRPGLQSGIDLGPRRLVPVALMATFSEGVTRELERQMRQSVPGENDARFVRQVLFDVAGLDAREQAVLARIDGVMPLGAVVQKRMDQTALKRLVARGIVQESGLTPSDAAHVLGHTDVWDRSAAEMALELLARRRAGHGERLAKDVQEMAAMIEAELQRRTGQALLEAAFGEEEMAGDPRDLADHRLMQAGLDGHAGLVRISAGLNVPVVGLGASARTYYGAVGARLGCDMLLPEDGGVANAIGAVVGRITMRREGTITAPSDGLYRAHLEAGPKDFSTAEAAIAAMQDVLEREAKDAALEAGAADVDLRAEVKTRAAQVEAREVFVEALVRVEASGRARVAV